VSTILDALRKAQAKHEEDEGEDPVEHGAADGTETLHADSPAADMSSTFDDVAPPDRVASAAKRPNVVAAVGVGLVGLALGIGAARVAGRAFFGGGAEPVQVASETSKSKATKPAEAKKSSALPDAAETHPQRESRARGAHAPKAEKGARDDAAADEIVDPEAQLEADASAPAGAAPAPLGATPPSAAVPVPGSVASRQNVPSPAPGAPRVPPPAPAGIAPEAPATAVFGGSVAVGPGNSIVPAPPRNAPDAAVAPVEHALPPAVVPGDPVQMAALTPPANTVPGGVPGEPAAGTVLETPPTGSPEVSLLFIKWSHDALRRVASLRGPGGKLLLVHEGDIVEGMRVSLIRADAVELQWRGSNFLLYAAR
jgi:hypothetical protein